LNYLRKKKNELEEILTEPLPEYPFSAEETERKKRITERIHSLGPAAALYIVNKIKNAKDTSKIFGLTVFLKHAHAISAEEEIGGLLELESVAHDPDRSSKHKILSILNRVGIVINIPQIVRFGEMSLDTKYGDNFSIVNFNRADVVDAIQTLLYIKSDLKKAEDINAVDKAIQYLNDQLSNRGYQTLSESELDTLALLSNRRKFNKEHKYDDEDQFEDIENLSELEDPFQQDTLDIFHEENSDASMRSLQMLIDLLEMPAHKRKEGDYDFFVNNIERRELFEYCRKIAEYLHDEQIPSLVIIDRSSRPLYIGVKEYWRYKYPHEKSPNVYFMNPKGFKTEKMDEQEVINNFKKVYKRLLEDKDKPVLVFDSCIHIGDTLTPVKEVMAKSGFDQVLIGSINPSDMRSSIKTDFYITKNRPKKGCYPFDRDRMIEKVFYRPHSVTTNDEQQVQRSIKLRREIKRIMEEKVFDKE
jgi:hypothetical protein